MFDVFVAPSIVSSLVTSRSQGIAVSNVAKVSDSFRSAMRTDVLLQTLLCNSSMISKAPRHVTLWGFKGCATSPERLSVK